MVEETVSKDILDKLGVGIEITGTDVDIRDLTSASDSIEVKQSTASNLKTEIYNPSGTVLGIANYISDGNSWYAMTGNSSGAQKTFFEWLTDNGTLIGGSGSGSNETVTLYTVPAGKVAYITSVAIGHNDLGGSAGEETKAIVGGNDVLRLANVMSSTESSTATSISPVIPIKITAGQTVQIFSWGTSCVVEGAFSGYEISA